MVCLVALNISVGRKENNISWMKLTKKVNSLNNKNVLLLVNVTSLIYPGRKAIAEHKYSWKRLPNSWAHLKSKPKASIIESTGAIHGIIGRMNWLSNIDAIYGACIFDGNAAVARTKLYPAYKSYSSIQDEKITVQIEPIQNFLRLTGWPIISIPQYEADDVIGTMTEHALNNGINVLIVSGDQNVLQLLTTGVKAIIPSPWFGSNNVYTHELLEQELSISPKLMPDVLALIGDKEKGVPGIPGMGQKTAIKLIKQHGGIESLLNQIDSVEKKYSSLVSENTEWIRKALFLGTIKTDCDLPLECFTPPLRQQAPISKESVDELIAYLKDYAIYDNGNIKAYASIKQKIKLTQEEATTNPELANKVHHVYRIRNKVTNGIYFGSTINIERRWKEHKTELTSGTHINRKMLMDFRLHGMNSFIFKKMHTEENLELGRSKEQFYITNFHGRASCYNQERFVEGIDISPKSYILTAEHVSFKKQAKKTKKELAGECARKKGWGCYLSIHAAAKDLGLSKKKISEAISNNSQYKEWIFTQLFLKPKKINHIIF